MGHKALMYRKKLEAGIAECRRHLTRLETAFSMLQAHCSFPLDKQQMLQLHEDPQLLAYSDQCIYRFSKLQDTMGAKLFKSVLLYLGESTDKPFLDILNELEKIDIVNVDEWFEIRDLRNEIAHDYEDDEGMAADILNTIFRLKDELAGILTQIEKLRNISRGSVP